MEYQHGSHTVYDVKYHIIWVTKYRYQVLRGEIAVRVRELVRQTCLSREITIVKGSVGKDHVHVLLSCPPTMAPSRIVQYIKGRTSRLIQEEFPHLKKRYWGKHLWARGYFCATVGAVTDELIKEYIANQDIEDGNDDFKVSDEFQS
jgi:putative transposase